MDCRGLKLKWKEKNLSGLIDTHAHLASSKFEGAIDSLITTAIDAGVGKIVSIACDIEDSYENLSLSQEFPGIVEPTAGIHPLYVDEVEESWGSKLKELVENHKLAAIGEIGLDYFHSPPKNFSEESWRAAQLEIFEIQLQLAIDFDLPVVIHQRNTAEDVTAVLKQFPKARAVLHCFTGTIPEAETALQMGHMISFTGILTFPNAPEIREVAAIVPTDRVMVETDCPYLAPVPFRGKRCEPHMVSHTASALADVFGVGIEEIAAITTRNAESFFNFSS